MIQINLRSGRNRDADLGVQVDIGGRRWDELGDGVDVCALPRCKTDS